MRVSFFRDDVDLCGCDPVPMDPRGMEADAIQAEFVEFRLQYLEPQARIHKRAENHVAAYAGVAVEVRKSQVDTPMRACRRQGTGDAGRLLQAGILFRVTWGVDQMETGLVGAADSGRRGLLAREFNSCGVG